MSKCPANELPTKANEATRTYTAGVFAFDTNHPRQSQPREACHPQQVNCYCRSGTRSTRAQAKPARRRSRHVSAGGADQNAPGERRPHWRRPASWVQRASGSPNGRQRDPQARFGSWCRESRGSGARPSGNDSARRAKVRISSVSGRWRHARCAVRRRLVRPSWSHGRAA